MAFSLHFTNPPLVQQLETPSVQKKKQASLSKKIKIAQILKVALGILGIVALGVSLGVPGLNADAAICLKYAGAGLILAAAVTQKCYREYAQARKKNEKVINGYKEYQEIWAKELSLNSYSRCNLD